MKLQIKTNWGINVKAKVDILKINYLMNSRDWRDRRDIAKQGYGLIPLINDVDWRVRKEVVRQGYRLETLIHDENWEVRYEVACQGYGLEILVNDEERIVRNLAQFLLGSKTVILSRNFGNYNGLLSVRIWKDKYQICSGCYKTHSLEEWSKECAEELDKKTSDLYTEKINELLEGLK